MERKAPHKELRGVLIAAILVVGLVTVLHESRRVQAVDCDLAFQNYMNADATYEMARWSYFYGVPTTCDEDCSSDPNPATCVQNCQTNRYTDFGEAQIAMTSLALDTCTPFTLDQCAQARGMHDACLAQWDWESQTYTDPEEISAAAHRYMACRTASKIDTCQ
jgi:hypothetical protein